MTGQNSIGHNSHISSMLKVQDIIYFNKPDIQPENNVLIVISVDNTLVFHWVGLEWTLLLNISDEIIGFKIIGMKKYWPNLQTLHMSSGTWVAADKSVMLFYACYYL